ncbi:DUF1987 domain-containing protein [Cesiribacter andamanensis]|uniref:SiaC family regulatory phosphoprotein domain-containing protein n=1 Tax=Cesiribacter andamanensis AMV16 TaxID=1279009 RepID=M7N4J9_9BACT|nr:DUF1987 domain-containing protein [Cesiribacter andamanensis]EMR03598.1 hypothetical protein ADICEAN_01279 [Cesiribacter andamanensis AMV16]
MLKPLYLEQKSDTPAIKLEPGGQLSITGRSLPENAEQFYRPILEWIERYRDQEANAETRLTIELEYFNSSSVKQILTLLLVLEELHRQPGKQVQIVWSYNQDDELMEMKGREMESIVDLPFVMEAFSL